ncbi:hypothetical protein RRG08_046070 [Elysia crispata]|uniref:Uncharacterized protein n=1 Tax=Elysia crispata TaxID=231223 RepID=A0AAE1CSK1_9GAST|nr:hypothetical protein RRG08_046070 [Elysia crispata]
MGRSEDSETDPDRRCYENRQHWVLQSGHLEPDLGSFRWLKKEKISACECKDREIELYVGRVDNREYPDRARSTAGCVLNSAMPGWLRCSGIKGMGEGMRIYWAGSIYDGRAVRAIKLDPLTRLNDLPPSNRKKILRASTRARLHLASVRVFPQTVSIVSLMASGGQNVARIQWSRADNPWIRWHALADPG